MGKLYLYLIRAGRCREWRSADHIFRYIQIYSRMHHFVVKFSGGNGALTPLTKILRTLLFARHEVAFWMDVLPCRTSGRPTARRTRQEPVAAKRKPPLPYTPTWVLRPTCSECIHEVQMPYLHSNPFIHIRLLVQQLTKRNFAVELK